MKKRPGRRSAASLAVISQPGSGPHLRPPDGLEEPAQALWREIVASLPADFFSPGDLPLLREYVHTIATLVPRLNAEIEVELTPKLLDSRDRLLKSALATATKLRLCVSARTRPDTAAMRDSMRPGPHIDFEAALREHD